MKKAKLYTDEKELCVDFAEHAKSLGWKVFPETSGCDLLLVAGDGVKTVGVDAGDQVGVQAKLKGNLEVLRQSIPGPHQTSGPAYQAVLIPEVTPDFEYIARELRILVFKGSTNNGWGPASKKIKGFGTSLIWVPRDLKLYYDAPLWHPDVELWTDPGVSSPKSITPWKVNSVRLCLDAIERGHVTTAHFREARISIKRWIDNKWLKDTGERVGKSKRYVINDATRPPHVLYPEIAAKIGRDNSLNEVEQEEHNRILSQRIRDRWSR